MSLTKKARNDAGVVVHSFCVTEPDLLTDHPFLALLDAIHADDLEETSRILDLDKALSLSCSPADLPTMTPPLIHAAWRGNKDIAELFLKRASEDGLDFTTICDVGYGANALHWAAASGKAIMLLELINRGGGNKCVNVRSFEGQTPLHAAACHGHLRCVSLLIAFKADPNLVDLRDSTPLHEAAEWGHADVVTELLKEKAMTEPRDHAGETPLLKAARGGHTPVVKLLGAKGVEVDSHNNAGITPLIFAAFLGHKEVVQELQKLGANAKAVDAARSRNALEWAAFNNHREVVETLLAGQVSAYKSVLKVAQEAEADDVLELLRSL